jgi:ketosteroid isomerase-like protein
MPTESTARNIFKAMNERDFDWFESHVTEHIGFDFPGTARAEGKRRTLLLLKSILRKYPELVFTVEEVIASDDRASVVWHNKGKSLSGEDYQNRGMTLVHFQGDKISLLSDYFKDTSFTR